MFVNCSNHKSIDWSESQKKAAHELGGEIIDMLFPNVVSTDTEDEVAKLADGMVNKILEVKPECVMCQGEFILTYNIVNRLLAGGIKTVAACSERVVTERTDENGLTSKTVVFQFVRFREYSNYNTCNLEG